MIGAGTVGILHMTAPDHWVTLAVLGRSKSWSRSKVFKVSLITSIGHTVLSLAIGIAVAAVGIVFSRLISGYLDIGIGLVMIVVGLAVGIRPLATKSGKQHAHENVHSHTHEHKYPDNPFESNEPVNKEGGGEKKAHKLRDSAGYFVVLGAALSPDPSIIPIFLASVPAGFYFLFELAVIFAATSVLTLILLVQIGNLGFAKVLEKIPEKYNDSLVGFVITAIGIFILVAGH
jgi:cadmium resistance protein CadD (predicted permease)